MNQTLKETSFNPLSVDFNIPLVKVSAKIELSGINKNEYTLLIYGNRGK